MRQILVTVFAGIIAPMITGTLRRWQWGRAYSPSLTAAMALLIFGALWAFIGGGEPLEQWLEAGLAASGLGAVAGNVGHRAAEKMARRREGG